MGSYTRTYSFTDGVDTAYGSQVAAELDALGSSVNNIVNAQIASGAAISDAKLDTLSTADKVNVSALGDAENIASPMSVSRGLKIVRTNEHVVTVTADELILVNSSGECRKITSVSEAIDIEGTAGAGALMTGLSEGNKWYYIWIIRKSSDGTVNGILTEDPATIATLPSGYNQYALVGAVYNDTDFINFVQYGKKYRFYTMRTLASGNAGVTIGTSWSATIDTTNFIPSALSHIAILQVGVGDGDEVRATNNSSLVPNPATPLVPGYWYAYNYGGAAAHDHWEIPILTANTLYWQSNNSTGHAIQVLGFDIDTLPLG